MTNKKANDLGCRYFDPNETMKQIHFVNPHLAICWGINKQVKCIHKDDEFEGWYKVMLLKVNANHWKKYVAITLSFMDLYDIHLVDDDLNVVEEVATEVYAEDLSTIIDDRIERIASYKN